MLEDSANLLFDIAKKDEKNRLAIRLQKHAGQSEGLVVPNSRLQDIIELMDTVKSGKQKASDDNDKVFLSAIHKIAMFEKAFNGAENQAEIENLYIFYVQILKKHHFPFIFICDIVLLHR